MIELRDIVRDGDAVQFVRHGEAEVEIAIHDTSLREAEEDMAAVVSYRDLLNLLSTELDAIVIPRSDLPEVIGSRGDGFKIGCLTVGRDIYRDGADAREVALGYLALAEHLESHPPKPPVDEADVAALAGALGDVTYLTPEEAESSARRLLETGRVQVTR